MAATSPYAYPFRDPNLSEDARLDDLISRLTLAEKISALSTNPSIPRLEVLGSRHVEGLHGLALGGPGKWGGDAPIPTTTFPQAIGLAETWDPELVEAVAEIESIEARFVFHTTGGTRGGLVVRAPNADLGRDPRWGRTEECYGEDAHLNSVMTAAFVRGLQGEHPRYFRAASLMKHFLANSNEDARESTSSNFDERLFHEYYAAPFRAGVEAGSRAYMAAYNAYNGVPCTIHPVLREITMERWGQDGIRCTDAGAYRMLVNDHETFATLPEAAAACIRASITQFLDDYRAGTEEALERGLLTEADIDAVLRGTYRVMLRLGLLDPPELVPYANVDAANNPVEFPAHRELARRVTQKSIVLLKNEGNLLPLEPASLRSVALIGPFTDDVLLDWYSGTPPYRVSPLDGLRARLGPGVEILHAPSRRHDAAAEVENEFPRRPSIGALDAAGEVEAETPELEARAVRAAAQADVAIVCVGNHPTGDGPWAKVALPSYGKEAVDRRSLELEDEALVRRVLAANPRTIVVLLSSFPYAICWTQDHVPAIVHVTHNSQELGHALADVLCGDVNPAGRLVQTWPRSIEQLPPMLDYDLRNGRTYMYLDTPPLYPFGYGQSYTTFAYRGLSAASALASNGELELRVLLENTGARAGDEVVQLYAEFPSSRVPRPRRKLVAFRRVTLDAGERREVSLVLRARELAYWDDAVRDFVVEPGPVRLGVGRSSTEIELVHIVSVENFAHT